MTTAEALFDEAGQARDEAIARVEEHARPDWMATCRSIVLAISDGGTFDTDTLWPALELAGVATHEPRAMGAVLRGLARDGSIAKTGEYRPSTRKENHARPIAVWRRCG